MWKFQKKMQTRFFLTKKLCLIHSWLGLHLVKKNMSRHHLQVYMALYSVSQNSSSPKTFCDIFTCGEPALLKITLVIAQTYSYVYTNFFIHLSLKF